MANGKGRTPGVLRVGGCGFWATGSALHLYHRGLPTAFAAGREGAASWVTGRQADSSPDASTDQAAPMGLQSPCTGCWGLQVQIPHLRANFLPWELSSLRGNP